MQDAREAKGGGSHYNRFSTINQDREELTSPLQEPTPLSSSSIPATARAWKKPNPNSAVLSRIAKCAMLSCSSLPTSRMLTVVSRQYPSQKRNQAHQIPLTAMRPNDVAQALDLDRIAKDHVWKVEPSCATSGEGKIGGSIN